MSQSWCGKSGLNPAERTVCQHADIGRLDARLNAVWESAPRSSADRRAQALWRTQERDPCRFDADCVRAAYDRRIAILGAGAPSRLAVNAPSWCRSAALNATEAAICRSTRLSAMDGELNAAWAAAHRSAADRRRQSAWRTGERDACGSDAACIGAAYGARLSALRAPPPAPPVRVLRRPWCGAATLSTTEGAICDDDALARLDAELDALGGIAGGRADALTWSRHSRDACLTDARCIAHAYLDRILEVAGGH